MSDNKDQLYSKLGVSAKKEDVHDAIKNIDKGLFPGAFCKIVEDVRDREEYCSVFHSDGAGTKSNLAYMYYKETGDLSVFKGIVRDAIIMNVDDILCIGATDPVFLSNNIGRNNILISGEILSTIIKEYSQFSKKLTSFGLKIIPCGGETADVGDIVKTLTVDASVFTSLKKKNVIDASKISNNDIIIGLESSGKAKYEDEYNSGIGSNGLTLARHGLLSHQYFKKYPECYNTNLDENLVFFGKYELTDKIDGLDLNIGKALLSPTKTYTPIILKILEKYRDQITALIHNTGGGQTKILNFGNGIKYIKDNLFEVPKIFELIQESSKTTWKEMFQVFNMGHRMEILCDEAISKEIINIASNFKVNAKIIGFCEESSKKNYLEIDSPYGKFSYKT